MLPKLLNTGFRELNDGLAHKYSKKWSFSVYTEDKESLSNSVHHRFTL